MRTYEKEQQSTVMFSGDDAQKIVSLRQEMDIEAEKICQELHAAYDRAEAKFKDLASEYEPRFQKAYSGTPLEGTPIGQIGVDFSKAEQHGVVFAKKIERNPLNVFLNMLRKATDEGPSSPNGDSIIFEEIGKSGDVSKRWGVDSRQREDA